MFCSMQPVLSMRQNGAHFLLTIIPLHFYILISLSEFNSIRYELLNINKLDYFGTLTEPHKSFGRVKEG